ncbi:IclR family transcriptional regulator [Paraburkholderia unamae]|uniref:IclR family transcriptional regulator n=1 Tax=Paraburkholderia unamae TaxID=219649 RepID=A0ABX5KMU8_9BURK|nr:helix-turn-helix domain-containing protein [Paraburkholderia unamae]PVX81605.1 IclR family transcriptional regulator [Paraburkholderia unamae]RAR62681.1 IclR family transcriptional regulator [Paraburkholderia unamae]CAG9274408.1 Transcriptional regulator [Paraburkholderia unamae]
MDLADMVAVAPGAPGVSSRFGTQSLARGIRLMRVIATRPLVGWRLTDLAIACDQDKATVRRMLACLVEERLVEQRESDRRYLPGPLMYELGLALPQHGAFQRRAEVIVEDFASRMGGIALFQLRSGSDFVCSIRAGTVQMTGAMVYPGGRRPLFTSAGGVAILQTLPPEEATAVLMDNVNQEIKRHGPVRLASLQKMRDRSERHGFGVNFGYVVPNSYAFAVPVRGSDGHAFGAVCIIGTPEAYGEERLDDVHEALVAVQARLEAAARECGL